VLIAQGNSQIAYGDGVITSRNTFQKYYDQEELKLYIDQVLESMRFQWRWALFCVSG
jgi:hypothetical protein